MACHPLRREPFRWGIPGVKFLITGRPEPHIQSGFRLGPLRPLTDVIVLHEVDTVHLPC